MSRCSRKTRFAPPPGGRRRIFKNRFLNDASHTVSMKKIRKKNCGTHSSRIVGVRICDVLYPPTHTPGGEGAENKKILRHVKKQISVAIRKSQNEMDISITIGVLARFVQRGREVRN